MRTKSKAAMLAALQRDSMALYVSAENGDTNEELHI